LFNFVAYPWWQPGLTSFRCDLNQEGAFAPWMI
jgi:hypothetical protein